MDHDPEAPPDRPPVRQRRTESLSFFNMVPNMVTILGLCSGLTAIRFVMADRFELAAALILFAAVIDGLDGLLARRLQATSDIGGQLDSLSDFLCFGVAPAFLVFQMALGPEPGIGWIFVLGYACCCCLRLARFNVSQDKAPDPELSSKPHFVGVPAPAGALLVLLPAFLSFEGVIDGSIHPWLADITLGLTGFLMVSRVPTFSPKSITVPRDKQGFILIAIALLIGIVLTRLWLLLIIVDLVYLAVVLWSARRWLRDRHAAPKA